MKALYFGKSSFGIWNHDMFSVFVVSANCFAYCGIFKCKLQVSCPALSKSHSWCLTSQNSIGLLHIFSNTPLNITKIFKRNRIQQERYSKIKEIWKGPLPRMLSKFWTFQFPKHWSFIFSSWDLLDRPSVDQVELNSTDCNLQWIFG